MAIPTRPLGSEGLVVSAQGLGCMGMSEFYGPGDLDESVATIHRALDLGVTFLDTADVYGPHTNEELVGAAINSRKNLRRLSSMDSPIGSTVAFVERSRANSMSTSRTAARIAWCRARSASSGAFARAVIAGWERPIDPKGS